MNCAVLDGETAPPRDAVMQVLEERGVETRPFFYPLHTLPPYEGSSSGSFPVAEFLAARGLNLPSSALLTQDDVEYVAAALSATLSVADAPTPADVRE